MTACTYHVTGTFCSHACKSCDDRMRWRSRHARINAYRSAARIMRETPTKKGR